MTRLHANRIIAAIERADSLWPQLDGLIEYVQADRYRANFSGDPYYMANRVSRARLRETDAPAVIRDLIEFYRRKQLDFVWIVGPLTTPSDLDRRLLEFGFEEVARSDGLCLDRLEKRQVRTEGFRVVEIPVVADSMAVPALAEGFDMPLESSQKYHLILSLAKEYLAIRAYVAMPDSRNRPAGCAYLTRYPDQPVALLSGAATVPEFRHRGIYAALLNQRINDAIDDGVETLIVLADQATSSPICRKFGFNKVCESRAFRYSHR